jgi:hypothetical protein
VQYPALSGRENAGEGRDRLSGGLKVECMETLVSVILIAPLACEGQMREHLAHFVEDGKRDCPCGLEGDLDGTGLTDNTKGRNNALTTMLLEVAALAASYGNPCGARKAGLSLARAWCGVAWGSWAMKRS